MYQISREDLVEKLMTGEVTEFFLAPRLSGLCDPNTEKVAQDIIGQWKKSCGLAEGLKSFIKNYEYRHCNTYSGMTACLYVDEQGEKEVTPKVYIQPEKTEEPPTAMQKAEKHYIFIGKVQDKIWKLKSLKNSNIMSFDETYALELLTEDFLPLFYEDESRAIKAVLDRFVIR